MTPPPEQLAGLLADLIAYANRTDINPIIQSATTHAQFELIHPFGDGNGRVGRVLVAWVLARRLSLVVPPPVSVAIAADVGGYSSGLVLFRMGEHDRWIQWFADAVASGGRSQRELINEVDSLKRAWRSRLGERERKLRSDSVAFDVLELLPRHLVLTSRTLVDELCVSTKTALAALRQLADSGVLREYGTVKGVGQPAKLYVSTDLLGLAGANPLR